MKTFEMHRQTYPMDSKYAKLMAEYAIISPMDSWGWGKDGVWEVWRDWLVKNRVSIKDAKAILEAQDRGMVHQAIGHEIKSKRDLDEVARRLKIAERRTVMGREDRMAVRVALDILAEGGDTEYQKFFKKKLEEHGVGSPAELDEEGKKKFFDEVGDEWTGEKTASRKTAGLREVNPSIAKTLLENKMSQYANPPSKSKAIYLEFDNMPEGALLRLDKVPKIKPEGKMKKGMAVTAKKAWTWNSGTPFSELLEAAWGIKTSSTKKASRNGVFNQMNDRELKNLIIKYEDYAPEDFWQDGEYQGSHSGRVRELMKIWRWWPEDYQQRHLDMLSEWFRDAKRLFDKYFP